jgi:hypothetical protein
MRKRALIILALLAAGLAVWFALSRGPEPTPPPTARALLWDLDLRDLRRVEIALGDGSAGEVWVQSEERIWYFDRPGEPRVDMDRWGGGVPYLLAAPHANNLIALEGTDEQFELFGLEPAAMRIHLADKHAETVDIRIGNPTPDGISYYLSLTDSRRIFTIDHTWYDIMERLVLDPPYLAGE